MTRDDLSRRLQRATTELVSIEHPRLLAQIGSVEPGDAADRRGTGRRSRGAVPSPGFRAAGLR